MHGKLYQGNVLFSSHKHVTKKNNYNSYNNHGHNDLEKKQG